MSIEVNYKRALNELHSNSKLADLQIKNWRGAMELAPAVIETLKAFDGKKITKRLETALQKINPNFRVVANIYGNGWECYVYFDERHVKKGEHWEYIKESEFYFFNCYKNDVLNAEEVINIINKTCERQKESIEHFLENFKNAEKILKRRAELMNELNAIHDELHYMFNDYADIKATRLYK